MPNYMKRGAAALDGGTPEVSTGNNLPPAAEVPPGTLRYVKGSKALYIATTGLVPGDLIVDDLTAAEGATPPGWAVKTAGTATYTIASGLVRSTNVTGIADVMHRNLTIPQQDVRVTMFRGATSGMSAILVNYDPATGTGYDIRFDSSNYVALQKAGTTLADPRNATAWTGATTTLRVTTNGMGKITVYQGATQLFTHTDDAAAYTGTSVALWQYGLNAGEFDQVTYSGTKTGPVWEPTS